jgi:hypothetical protein
MDFESLEKSVEIQRNGLFMYGVGAGFSFPLGRLVRLLLGCTFEGGSATDDTLQTVRPATVENYYYHVACGPSFQCALGTFGRVTPYVTGGAGASLVWVNERTFFLDEPSQEVLFTDRQYVNGTSYSFSADAGIGMDVALSSRWALSIAATLRFLSPVSYRIKEDYPLTAMNYRETLYGGDLKAGLLFGFR